MSKLIFIALLGAAVCSADSITYDVALTVANGSVNGTITTDGTIGGLGPTNTHVIGFDLTLFDSVNTAEIIDGVGGAGVSFFGSGAGITASATELTFDFSGTTEALFQYDLANGGSFVCFEGVNTCTGFGPGTVVGAASSPGAGDQFNNQQYAPESGVKVIATVARSTPEPSAFVLFGTGLLMIGTRKWRR